MLDAPERTSRRLPTMLVAGFAVIALIASACSRSETASSSNQAGDPNQVAQGNKLEPDETPKQGGKIIMAVTAETNGWNPASSQWADAGSFVGSTVLEPLMTYDGKGNNIPWLAESVEPKTPGQFDAWVIKIRPGIQFSNGSPLDAAIVKRNLGVFTGETALSGLALAGMFKDIKVVDPMTVEVDLNVPWAAFPNTISGAVGYQMAAEQLDAPDGGRGKPIGTGPFVFDSWQQDNFFKAKKNPNYWRKDAAGRQLPYLDEVEFRPVTDSKLRTQALQSGDIDMLLTTRAEDASALQDRYTVVTDYNGEKTFVMLNVAEDPTKTINPFKNIRARRALAYATNRDAVIAAVSPDTPLKSSTTPVVAGTRWEVDENDTGYYPFDQAKARAEVEAYKAETGEPGIKFQFAGLSNLEDQKIMQILQAQWAEVGIESTIDTREQTSYITQLVLGGFQAAYFRNYAYLNPDSDWVFWHSSQAKGLGVLSINFHQLKDSELDAAIDDARRTDDAAKQKADYLAATKRINDQAVNIWLFNTPYAIIAQPRVRGLNPARQQGFGDFQPKPWFWAGIWKS
ncbi:MAG: ABC transporter substrate-binding protein [Actinobacteria bacterium]|nr:ABC transporter substrate-binding protein [Actinomycetota bacterium]